MSFSSIRLLGFRNLVDGEIETRRGRVFLIGENGQGKSNFLEALYYLSYGSSFRGASDSEATRSGEEGFVLSCLSDDNSRLDDEIRIFWNGRSKEIRLNGKPVRDRKYLVERSPSVLFCHEDFSFAAGEPERRRFFFDQTAGLVSADYIDKLRDYKRILKQRNAVLREGRVELLDTLDQQLAAHGIQLGRARQNLSGQLSDGFSERYESVSLRGSPVCINYRPSWPEGLGTEEIVARLSGKRREELAMKTSLSGPHRDRWIFRDGQSDYAATASTGQLRLLSLTLRIAQAEYYTRKTGKLPILLLDDVMLELDPAKRQRFFNLLPPSSQAFFTFLPGEPWKDYGGSDTLVYKVEHGKLSL
jgi:DNA replication and repair protein RecF